MARRDNNTRGGRSSRDASLRYGERSSRRDASYGSSRDRSSRARNDYSSSRGFLSSFLQSSPDLCVSHGVFSSRAGILLILFAVMVVAIFGRLVWMQIIEADNYTALAESSRTATYTQLPHRGTIYDRNGNVLAVSVESKSVYAYSGEVSNPRAAADIMASIYDHEASYYYEMMTREGRYFIYLERQGDVDKADQLKAALKEQGITGIEYQTEMRREYPYGSIGGQVVGMCNVDGVGISGLELQYDDILTGTGGSKTVERGSSGLPIPDGFEEYTAAVDGQDIIISIDIELQEQVETSLQEGVEKLGAPGGSCVVMDAGTGEIYASASLPYFNPADPASSESSSDQLKTVTQAFEPGSIFKTVSAMAILEAGTMSPDDTIYCPASIEADEYVVSDAHERSDATFSLRQIIDQSSNVGISLSVENMGFEQFYNKIKEYNLNTKTGVDYPGESSGLLQDYSSWAKITAYNACFGQGLTVTPLQMTRFYGSLINDGVEVTPHFLIELPLTGETPEYETEEVITNKSALSDMVDMLRTVVVDGTGKSAAIDGYTVAGKTSTAEIAENGSYRQGVYNLCFTGFLPGSSSQLVCFVGANEVPQQGTVAPIFKDIMTYAIDRYKIMPE